MLQVESLSIRDGRRAYVNLLSQPFQSVKDVEAASSQEAQRLYDQASSVSAIAYLLLGAAGPLSTAHGSSGALLPYLQPPVLRIYASQPGVCSSSRVAQLYGLSQSLYGSIALQTCHYDLFRALRATFTWVATNNTIPLRLQTVSGQPRTTAAAWPDRAAISDADFAAAVSAALLTRPELAETATLLSDSCGLGVSQFAGVIPSISSALQQLHADLAELQTIAKTRLSASIDSEVRQRGFGPRGLVGQQGRRRAAAAEYLEGDVGRARTQHKMTTDGVPWRARGLQGSSAGSVGDGDGAIGGSLSSGEEGMDMRHLAETRRALQALSPNFVYAMPPGGFKVQPPSALPRVLIGLVFHIFLYRDVNGAVGPAGYEHALSYAERMVRIANLMAKPTNIGFFIREMRNNATAHPYLLMKTRKAWLALVNPNCVGKTCLGTSDLVTQSVSDFPRSINIYVGSDASSTNNVLGYTYTPGSEFIPLQGFVAITWDNMSPAGSNSLALYNDGVTTLMHEVFHFLGVHHTFSNPPARCTDWDYVSDTPIVDGSIFQQDFNNAASNYCMEVFWGLYGGDWEATFQRWGSSLGIPDLDKNAWADSCPNLPGYDELGNWMTYSSPVCFAALGHFTRGQAEWAHFATSEVNPVMYTWGQYYAAQAAPPPPQLSPPSEPPVEHICRVTQLSACPCKAVWRLNKQQYSYCDRTSGVNRLTCEVVDRDACPDCATIRGQCVLQCEGTPQQCKKPPAPGVRLPPPPPPFPPSSPPAPPPPPPLDVPVECKVAANNCACRSNWIYNFKRGYYCSLYTTQALWCVVTPECPAFMDSPLQPCSLKLKPAFCNGTASAAPPPTPPAPPPGRPAAPPPGPPPRTTAPPPRTPKKPRRPR